MVDGAAQQCIRANLAVDGFRDEAGPLMRGLIVLPAVLLAGLLILPSAAAAQVKTATFGQTKQDIGGYKPHEDPTLGAAVDFFGAADVARASGFGDEICSLRYNDLGMTLTFYHLGGHPDGSTACDTTEDSRLNDVRFGGTNARNNWRTSKGLRVGSTERYMRQKYRVRQPDGYGRRQYLLSAPPALTASLSRTGKVTSIQVFLGYGGD